MTVYIVRHGESLANLHSNLPLKEGFQDITDDAVPLSQWGYGQAVEAGKALRGELKQAAGAGRKLKVIHSPFLRTQQTTQGVLEGLGDAAPQEATASMHLREQDFGLFSCITDRKLIAALWPKEHAQFVRDRQRDKHTAKAPGGESRMDVVERAKQLVENHRADFEDPNTDVVLIGHGLVNRAVEMCLRGEDKEWLRKEPNPGNCAIRKLEGELANGYSAAYVHQGRPRPTSLPKDHMADPHGHERQMAM